MIDFRINKSDCFNENDKTIKVIQGNSAVISAMLIDSETEENIILGDNDAVLWYVKTISGREIAKRVFTKDDMLDDGSVELKLHPEDTVKIPATPSGYIYGLSYSIDNGNDFYTYCHGKFIVERSCGTVDDLV